jgi:hypothetical protein
MPIYSVIIPYFRIIAMNTLVANILCGPYTEKGEKGVWMVWSGNLPVGFPNERCGYGLPYDNSFTLKEKIIKYHKKTKILD